MEILKNSLFFIILLASMSCAKNNTKATPKSENNILNYGYFGMDESNNRCVVLKYEVEVGGMIYIVEPNDLTYKKALLKSAVNKCEAYSYFDEKGYGYNINVSNEINIDNYFAFQLSNKIIEKDDTIIFNIDGGNNSTRVCYNMESFYFSVWSGEPLKSTKLFGAPLYLGFNLDEDATPSCSDLEY